MNGMLGLPHNETTQKLLESDKELIQLQKATIEALQLQVEQHKVIEKGLKLVLKLLLQYIDHAVITQSYFSLLQLANAANEARKTVKDEV